jgi:glycosyltransferase involved in cell wall biosynthesis
MKLMNNLNIGVVNFPGGLKDKNFIPLSNLILILNKISDDIFVILGKDEYLSQKGNFSKLHFFPIENSSYLTPTLRLINFGIIQIKIALNILIIGNKVDYWIFFIGGDTLVLPGLISRILRKKIFILIAGSSIKTLESQRDSLSSGLKILQFITISCANKIILYSDILIEDYGLKRWKKKSLVSYQHFIKSDTFNVTTPLTSRSPLIGYIGRLSVEKGVQNFVQALPGILSDQQDLRVFIGGDGELKESIASSLRAEKLVDRVDLAGWISYDDLPRHLNQLRFLVIPSYTEGLPNILIEAMACGTPVLATPVGAIPAVIRDGETGFIMENNSPECIAKNVMRMLSSPALETIAENGRRFVEENFTFEKTMKNWNNIFQDIK